MLTSVDIHHQAAAARPYAPIISFPNPAPPVEDIRQFNSEFSCPDSEAAFLLAHSAETLRGLRVTLLFCAAFFVAFSMTDFAVLGWGPDALTLLGVRLVVGAAALGGVWLAGRQPQSAGIARLAATAVEALAMAAFLLIASYRPHEFMLHGMSITIMVVIVYIFIPNRLYYAMGVALTATAGFLALAWDVGHLRAHELQPMAMLLLLANLFGCVAARRYERLRREQYRANQVLVNLSERDHLTGCFNRRPLNDRLLDQEIARARRYGLTLTLVMCDLDSFKAINDTHGHQAGDAVLCRFAHMLRQMTREGVDTVVRYGGEEFLLILPETDLAGGVELAERLRTSFGASTTTAQEGGAPIAATASFGVVTADFGVIEKPVTQRTLVALADELMYAAKHGGRNQVRSREVS